MDSLISHSSGNSKQSRLPSPGISFHSSFSLEELILPESPTTDPCAVGCYLDHLPSTANELLDRFDRVLKVVDDVFHLETSLEQVQRRISKNKKEQKSPSMEKVVTLASRTHLRLPRTYSSFSESALARLRAHHVRISSCSATEACKQLPMDAILQQRSRCEVLLGNPASGNLCQRIPLWAGHLFKRRPKSEEGQGCHCCDALEKQIPLKRRAWQTEGTGAM